MDKMAINKVANELIEQAKQMSKEKFLIFAKEVYGIDEDAWEHLWQIPIVATYEDETIFPAELSSKNRDDIIDALDECIEGQIGDSEAVFIPFEDIIASLPDEAAQEYENGISDGSILEEYNAVIVYNEGLLIKNFREFIEAGSKTNPPKTIEDIKSDYLNDVSKIFLHERMHLNSNTLVIDNTAPDLLPLVNGAEFGYNRNYEDYNEVLIDTMAKIVQTYSKGDTIEDCLYRVIEKRGGKSDFKKIDDRLVLSLFTLFPDELSKWTMFEAYDEQHENLLKQKYDEVFGGNNVFRRDEMLKKVGDYFNQTSLESMSVEQLTKRKKMLEMIGVKNINLKQTQKIEIDQIEALATSESAMEQLSGSFHDIKLAHNELHNTKQKGIE